MLCIKCKACGKKRSVGISGIPAYLIFFSVLFFQLSIPYMAPPYAFAEKKELTYPNAANRLFIDSANIKDYQSFAQSLGFELNHQYSYTEYAGIKRQNKIGVAGAYESLLFSTGGNGQDYNALLRWNKEKCGWEMKYYSNHDVTVINEVCHDDSRTHSFIRIIKICSGKNMKLHLE